MLKKIDYNEVARQFYNESQHSKEQVLEKIFGKAYKLIETFNEKAKFIEDHAKKVS